MKSNITKHIWSGHALKNEDAIPSILISTDKAEELIEVCSAG